MAFDPAVFQAELALGWIPFEEVPLRAQDALEAGFDGPGVLRMAVLERPSGWEVDQVMPHMLSDLGLSAMEPREAALVLAKVRVKRILFSGEDPLRSTQYFHSLLLASDYEGELFELAYLDDALFDCNEEKVRASAFDSLQEFLDPELRGQKQAERKALWEEQQQRAKEDWPYVFDSPGGRRRLKERVIEHLMYARPAFALQVMACLILGWCVDSWRTAVLGPLIALPFTVGIGTLAHIAQLRRERKDILLRTGYWK